MGYLPLLLVATVGASIQVCQCAEICILPYVATGSQLAVLQALGDELVARGHDVTIIAADVYGGLNGSQSGVKHYVYKADAYPIIVEYLKKQLETTGEVDIWSIVNGTVTFAARSIDGILRDDAVMAIIKASDLIISVSPHLGNPLIAEYFNKPRVDLSFGYVTLFSYYYGAPKPSGYVPEIFSAYDESMTLRQRVFNFLFANAQWLIYKFTVESQLHSMQHKYGIATDQQYSTLLGKAQAVIVQSDFAVEYAHPLTPNMKYVGPLLPRPAVSLCDELEAFMQGSGEHGVVVVAFGTYISSHIAGYNDMLLEAFSSIKQRVVWNCNLPATVRLSDNVMVRPWIPQNDLLGHSKTRAFVSHMGHNSAFEAAYHGVPLVAVPMVLDQQANAVRFSKKGKMALVVDIRTIDAQGLRDAIREVIANPWYKSNATRLSRILQSNHRSSRERAADVVEEVLASGCDVTHLHPHSLQLPFYIRNSMDVLCVLVAVIVAIVWLLKLVVHFLGGICRLSHAKLKQN